MLQLIPEPLSEGKITAKWSSVNSLAAFAARWNNQGLKRAFFCKKTSLLDYLLMMAQKAVDEGGDGIPLKYPVTIKEMRWDADNQSSVLRSLINESQEIFLSLQAAAKDSVKIPESVLLDFSRRYRAVMHSCLIQLQKKREKSTSPTDEEEVNAEKTIELETSSVERLSIFEDHCQILLLHYMEMIWNLAEIVLIDTQPGGFCLGNLLTWVQWHFTAPDDIAQRVMSASDPYGHVEYWDCVSAYLLQGRITQVKDMLTHHPARDRTTFDAFASIEDLLNKMPTFKVLNTQSLGEFQMAWTRWQQECLTRLHGGDFQDQPELRMLCDILTGSEEALQANRHLCDTWYQYLVARLQFSEPAVKTFDLHSHAVSCIESLDGFSLLTQLDEIVLATLEFDVNKVIRRCSETFPNWWFVAHLTDMLYHAGQLESRPSEEGLDLREFLLLEYSASLMSHKSMWIVAAEYLVHCPKFGRQHLAAYVERIPLENELKANKVICLCERHGLDEQVRTVCTVMGMRALKRGRLGSALSWCIRAKDQAFGSIISERYFKFYAETGGFSHLDLLDNLGSTMLLSNHLTFLGKYREFHRLYAEGDFVRAGDLLVSLLASRLAPPRFWTILLTDALPLLEDKKIIFDTNQSYEILKCLQEIDSTSTTHGEIQKQELVQTQAEQEEESDKIELLRLGIARNLARAALEEAS